MRECVCEGGCVSVRIARMCVCQREREMFVHVRSACVRVRECVCECV